jgi:hypothetical protein
MTKRIWAASYERGVELAAAGCPLDLDALKNDWAAAGKSLWAKQMIGYAESCVYVLGASLTGFVIGLRLGINRGVGTAIAEWSFVPPWPDHLICWDYEASDVIPELHLGSYRDVLESRLLQILDNRCLLRPGYPVEGLLYGLSNQQIPESGEGLVFGKLRLIDDKGNEVSLRIDLRIYQAAATRSGRNLRPRRGALLDKVDRISVGSKRGDV